MSTNKTQKLCEAYTQGQFYTGDSVHAGSPDAPPAEAIQKIIDHGWGDFNKPQVDMVNSPSHYKTGKIECIEAMEEMLTAEEFIGYLRGNAFKYLWRYRSKGKAYEDLQKAQWYLNRLVSIHNPK
jgi:hypothetical protein